MDLTALHKQLVCALALYPGENSGIACSVAV
jgi:hypothetical protein